MKNNIIMTGIILVLLAVMAFGIRTAILSEKEEETTEKVTIDVTNQCDTQIKAMGIRVYNGEDLVCGQTGMNADGSSYKSGEVIHFMLIENDFESLSDENAVLKVVFTVSDGNNDYEVKGAVNIKKEYGRTYKATLHGDSSKGFVVGE